MAALVIRLRQALQEQSWDSQKVHRTYEVELPLQGMAQKGYSYILFGLPVMTFPMQH